MLDITIKGSEDLRKMARALRLADKEGMRRELGTAMREGGKPTLQAVKRSAENITTHGYSKPGAVHPFTKVMPQRGTRRKFADAATLDVKVEEENPRVRFRILEAELPPDLKGMARKFDSGKPWRHPVLGNRNAWVTQTGNPWFWAPIRDHIKDFRAAIDNALDRVRDKLARS
jgi:hypothetical protein